MAAAVPNSRRSPFTVTLTFKPAFQRYSQHATSAAKAASHRPAALRTDLDMAQQQNVIHAYRQEGIIGKDLQAHRTTGANAHQHYCILSALLSEARVFRSQRNLVPEAEKKDDEMILRALLQKIRDAFSPCFLKVKNQLQQQDIQSAEGQQQPNEDSEFQDPYVAALNLIKSCRMFKQQ